MRYVLTMIAVCLLVSCGTIGGTIDGMGEDLKRTGQYIKNKGK